jgi:nucleoside-diphosphate-sugar epimerase
MKILIIGGAGFIGSNLCDYLLLKGRKSNLSSVIGKIEFYKEIINDY